MATGTSTPTPSPVPTNTATPDKGPLEVTYQKGASGLAGELPVADQGNSKVPVFVGYSFEYLAPGRTPILKVRMNRPRFQAQFSKVDAKTYQVFVPNAVVVGPHVTLPQFPPADFTGFVMLTARQVEGDQKGVEISISIEEGVTLGSFVRDNEIIIKQL